MLFELLKLYYFGFITGTSITCLLITLLVLLNKKRELIICEKYRSILVFEVLLLLIGIFTIFWFGIDVLVGG